MTGQRPTRRTSSSSRSGTARRAGTRSHTRRRSTRPVRRTRSVSSSLGAALGTFLVGLLLDLPTWVKIVLVGVALLIGLVVFWRMRAGGPLPAEADGGPAPDSADPAPSDPAQGQP